MSDSDPYWALRIVLRVLWFVAAVPVGAVLWGLEHAHAPWWVSTGWLGAYLGVGRLVFAGMFRRRPAAAAAVTPKPPAP